MSTEHACRNRNIKERYCITVLEKHFELSLFRIATWSENLLIVLAAHKPLMADEYDDCYYGRIAGSSVPN